MTILIGLTCREGVILASDSQSTSDPHATSVNKLSTIKFRTDEAIASKAGDMAITNRLVEFIQDKAADVWLETNRQVADLAEAAVRKIRDQLVDEDQKRRLADNGIALMLAHFSGNLPSLYVIDDLGIANRIDDYYAVAGCGGPLAECLLAEFTSPPNTLSDAVATAIYVIEKVKRYNAYCGGPTRIKVAEKVPTTNPKPNDPTSFGVSKVTDFPQDLIDSIEMEVAMSEQMGKPKRTERLSAVLTRLGKRRWAAYLKKVEAEQKARTPQNNRQPPSA